MRDVEGKEGNTWKHLLDSKEAEIKRLYEMRFGEIGRKEFHTLGKSSVLESARLGFTRGLTKHLGDV